MNVNLFRIRPLLKELTLIRRELSRIADLKELELQSVHGLTTRVAQATMDDLKSTSVAYSDPEFDQFRQQFESRTGRPMTDEELSRLEALLQENQE